MSDREDLSNLGIFAFHDIKDISHLKLNALIDSNFKRICVRSITKMVRDELLLYFEWISKEKISKDLSEKGSWKMLDNTESLLFAKVLKDDTAEILIASKVMVLLVFLEKSNHHFF